MTGRTRGTLLGGRVRYDQFVSGYRTGIEPVLLAAAVDARPGEHVLEAGAGAGAALLCLAARVPGIIGLGIERDPELAGLAGENAAANHAAMLRFDAGAIEAFVPDRRFDHAMANPPWHDAAGTVSDDPGRAGAKTAAPDLLRRWIAALAQCLRPRGSLTLILPAAQIDRAIMGCGDAGCGSLGLLPLWPGVGKPARLVVLRARRGGRAGLALSPGLILHRADGGYTEAADEVLRHAGALR